MPKKPTTAAPVVFPESVISTIVDVVRAAVPLSVVMNISISDATEHLLRAVDDRKAALDLRTLIDATTPR